MVLLACVETPLVTSMAASIFPPSRPERTLQKKTVSDCDVKHSQMSVHVRVKQERKAVRDKQPLCTVYKHLYTCIC